MHFRKYFDVKQLLGQLFINFIFAQFKISNLILFSLKGIWA